MDKLLQGVQFLPGVGPGRSRQLSRLNLHTIFDLLWHIPRTYIDRNNLDSFDNLPVGEKCHIKGTVIAVNNSRSRKGLNIFKAVIENEKTQMTALWFNQPYLHKLIQPGQTLYLSGRAKANGLQTDFLVEEYAVLDDDEDLRIMPVYHLTEGINQKRMRQLILHVLSDCLPDYRKYSPPGEEKNTSCAI